MVIDLRFQVAKSSASTELRGESKAGHSLLPVLPAPDNLVKEHSSSQQGLLPYGRMTELPDAVLATAKGDLAGADKPSKKLSATEKRKLREKQKKAQQRKDRSAPFVEHTIHSKSVLCQSRCISRVMPDYRNICHSQQRPYNKPAAGRLGLSEQLLKIPSR